jgi:hypothetical protein
MCCLAAHHTQYHWAGTHHGDEKQHTNLIPERMSIQLVPKVCWCRMRRRRCGCRRGRCPAGGHGPSWLMCSGLSLCLVPVFHLPLLWCALVQSSPHRSLAPASLKLPQTPAIPRPGQPKYPAAQLRACAPWCANAEAPRRLLPPAGAAGLAGCSCHRQAAVHSSQRAACRLAAAWVSRPARRTEGCGRSGACFPRQTKQY